MSQSNIELQRLLRLLADTATKAEEEAYAAGWRDCRAAILNAVSTIGSEPHQHGNGIHHHDAEPHVESAWQSPVELNGAGAAESSYTN